MKSIHCYIPVTMNGPVQLSEYVEPDEKGSMLCYTNETSGSVDFQVAHTLRAIDSVTPRTTIHGPGLNSMIDNR